MHAELPPLTVSMIQCDVHFVSLYLPLKGKACLLCLPSGPFQPCTANHTSCQHDCFTLNPVVLFRKPGSVYGAEMMQPYGKINKVAWVINI